MGNGISSAITNSWVASNQRRVKDWLDNAAEESVLDSLTSSFFPAGKAWALPAAQDAVPYIKGTFNAYGSTDPVDKTHYWYEKDLALFLSKYFGGRELNASIPLLWRCFHFHAYFPFPRETGRLDYSAFQRAIGLLAAEGNLRLGNNADGITMDRDRYPDANARASKRLWILFKSLSARTPLPDQYKSTDSSVLDLSTMEDDLMDVLALTQPDNPCIMPAPIEDLRPHAKRILGSSKCHTYYSIPQRDILSLLELMLSIQIDKPEWGSHQPYFNTGRILLPPNLEILRGAADSILESFSHEVTADLGWHEFHKVLSVHLPGFLSKFRLIFTTFLSPLIATNQTLLTSPSSTLPIPYAQYLQLFLHPPLAHPTRHVFEDFARQKADHALQTTQRAYSAAPPTLNTTDLTAVLSSIKTGTLLLITGDAQLTESMVLTRVVIGACMPTPWDLERQRSFRASPPQKLHTYTPGHMLFQLEPCHKILRPEEDAWIMDLIHIINSNPGNGGKGSLQFGPASGSGLFVDFDNGTATLKSLPTPHPEKDQSPQSANPSTPSNTYHSISPPTQASNDWEIRLQIQKLEIYDLGGDPTPPFEEQLVPKPQLRTASPEPYDRQVITEGATSAARASELGVGEEELKKRIMEFGADG